jgi:hypothetical protein
MRVVDASPLIHLCRLSVLESLREPRPDIAVVVTSIVVHEVMRGAQRDPTVHLVAEAMSDRLGSNLLSRRILASIAKVWIAEKSRY